MNCCALFLCVGMWYNGDINRTKKHRREWLDNFVPPMNRRKFERVGKGVSQNGQPPVAHAAGAESGPVPNGTPPEQAFTVCGYWSNIFVKPMLCAHF